MAVIVENAGHGSTVAAPIADKIIELYLEKNYPEIAPPREQLPAPDTALTVPIASAEPPDPPGLLEDR